MPNPQIWTDEFLNECRLQGDLLADAAMEELLQSTDPAEARRFFHRLIRQIEMPESEFPGRLQDYFGAVRQLPPDVDWSKIRMAQEFFLDHGPKCLVFLYYKSLPLLYSCRNGAEVLARTGRLSHQEGSRQAVFTRRIAETGQFLLSVMTPGGLQPEGEGIQVIRKVRLIHASIRKFTNSEEWDTAKLGKPINQEDLAITLMTFSVSIIDALHQFGITESAEKEEAYFYTWRMIGLLLGVRPELIPDTLSDGRKLIDKILQRQAGPSDAGRQLANALVQFAQETLQGKLQSVPPVLMEFLIGKNYASMLQLQASQGCLGFVLPEFMTALLRLGERLEDKFDGPVELLLEKLSKQTMLAMVQFFDEYKERSFHIPESLAVSWSLK